MAQELSACERARAAGKDFPAIWRSISLIGLLATAKGAALMLAPQFGV